MVWTQPHSERSLSCRAQDPGGQEAAPALLAASLPGEERSGQRGFGAQTLRPGAWRPRPRTAVGRGEGPPGRHPGDQLLRLPNLGACLSIFANLFK